MGLLKALPLEEVLPQKPPMILLSGYDPESLTEDGISAWVDISESSLFYEEELGGVPVSVAVEYMAQTVACYVGLAQISNHLPPKIGFLLGSRNISLKIPAFLKGERYRIESELLYEEDGFASFSVSILDKDGACVVKGNLNAFQPDDPNKILNEQEMAQ